MIAIFRILLGKVRCLSWHGQHPPDGQSSTHRVCTQAAPWVLVVTAATFALGAASNFQNGPQRAVLGQESPTAEIEPMTPLKPKQKQAILKSNFGKMKRDAEDLSALAKSLQEEIDKSNENVLSLKVVEKAEKIERLARKIKAVAKGE